jgi:hypothetical protein
MTRLAALVLSLPLALIACTGSRTPVEEPPYPTSFSDAGVRAEARVSRYFESSVAPALTGCWGEIQGEGAVAMDLTYRKSEEQWMLAQASITTSSLNGGQDAVAQRCIEQSARGTGFPVDRGEAIEAAAERFVLRISIPVPLAPEGPRPSAAEIARRLGMDGGGGGTEPLGCSACVSRREPPYGLKCETRSSGGHLDCREHDSNVCSTGPTACLRGASWGGGGVTMF